MTWDPDRFRKKNANRRLCKGPAGSAQRRDYLAGRRLRRSYLLNGAFGEAKRQTWLGVYSEPFTRGTTRWSS
jgi:hypothetical protein